MGLDRDVPELDAYAVQLIRRKARQLVGRAGFTEDDQEDIEQDLTLDLLHRLPKFDSLRASLHTFIARVVEHGVARLIERQEAPMRDYRRCTCSLNDPIRDDRADGAERGDFISQEDYLKGIGQPALLLADGVALKLDLERLLSTLPPELRDLMSRLDNGQTIAEIARDIGLSRGTLYDRMKELRLLAEEAGLKAYLESD